MHMGYRALDRIVISSRSQKHYKHVLLSEFVTKHEFMKVGWKRRCVLMLLMLWRMLII